MVQSCSAAAASDTSHSWKAGQSDLNLMLYSQAIAKPKIISLLVALVCGCDYCAALARKPRKKVTLVAAVT